jgi:hypothetical protein
VDDEPIPNHTVRDIVNATSEHIKMSDTVVETAIETAFEAERDRGVWQLASSRGKFDRDPFFEDPEVVAYMLLKRWLGEQYDLSHALNTCEM